MNLKAIATFLKKPVGIALLVFAMIVALSVFITVKRFQSTEHSQSNIASYVGSIKCQSCHQKEYALYKSSDHFHAMDSALPRSVKGNLSNSFFVYLLDTSFFY